VKFLDGEATTKEIVRLMEFPEGQDGGRLLGPRRAGWPASEGRAKTASVVCNLFAGGTNPREIK